MFIIEVVVGVVVLQWNILKGGFNILFTPFTYMRRAVVFMIIADFIHCSLGH